MNAIDYDKALFYMNRGEWDNLLILMVRTKDDFLSKKIEQFLHACNYSRDYSMIETMADQLLMYVDHALSNMTTALPHSN